MEKIFYPAIFTKEKVGYSVYVPDIPGCNTQGDTMSEASDMAFDAIGLCISVMLDDGKEIPVPSAPDTFKLAENEFVVMISFDFEEYSRMSDTRAVKKTLTIPAWLNTMSEREGINFSAVLQAALKEKLNITR